jgi:hypothetical protein
MMMKQNELNLSQTLTENRVPASVRGSEAYRLIFWTTDVETGKQRVHDVNEYGAKRAIKDFNRLRAVWASEGLRVTIEAKI